MPFLNSNVLEGKVSKLICPQCMTFPETLLSWYASHKRDLPWRASSDPYRVWISEIILQQTRVDQGMAYFFRFVERFPDVIALADADESDVLRLWQGLGYYSRARNLHATARLIRDEYGGAFPSSYERLIRLPGIGPYTAAAISSICFGEVKAVVDGNVIRVLSRVFGLDEPSDSSAGKKLFQTLADELISSFSPGDFNQAIMDFGALQCVPRSPRCTDCPFAEVCVARKTNRIHELPVKGRKTQVMEVWYYYAMPIDRGYTWVRRRSHSGIWKGLHDFPCIESGQPLGAKEVRQLFGEKLMLELPVNAFEDAELFTHQLSHRKIQAAFFRWNGKFMWKNKPDAYQRVPLKSLGEIGIPRLIDRYLHG